MYKVFTNNKSINFLRNKDIYSNNSLYFDLLDFTKINKIYKEFIFSDKEHLNIICNKLCKTTFDLFKKEFLFMKAAGGVVLNKKNEILFIYRRGYWDLPKGKVEKNENLRNAAIRETIEETGLIELKIIKRLKPTYHIYNEKGIDILKKTSWFLMQTNSNQKLIPQTEEDIEIAKWVNKSEFNKIYLNTYNSLIPTIKFAENLLANTKDM